MAALRYKITKRQIGRALALAAALPCVYATSAALTFFFQQRALYAAQASQELPALPAPDAATRLLVFAPHCDDDMLGCAGLIRQTLAAHGAVQVAMFTNGDAFAPAVQRQERSVRVEPADFIRFACQRQQEAKNALRALGVESDSIRFFGYPDRGLLSLWNTHWSPEKPFLSAYTRCQRAPYAGLQTPNAPYCGRSALEDAKRALREFRPTVVTVTHPADDHADHAAAAAFVAKALQEIQADPTEREWANKTRLQYYLVHRGNWPSRSAHSENAPLLPPAEMNYLDTQWRIRPLSAEDTARKRQSIALHASQMAMMQKFLLSFDRKNELFGEMEREQIDIAPEGAMRLNGNPKQWSLFAPVALSPLSDNMARTLQGGADIQALYACHDSQTLYLRAETRQPLAKRVRLAVRLRPFGNQGETSETALVVASDAPNAFAEQGLKTTLRGNAFEIAVPLRLLTQRIGAQPQTLGVSVETSIAGLEIDSTGIRLLHF